MLLKRTPVWMAVALLGMMLFSMQGMAASQIYSLGNYNITLELGEKVISMEPQPSSSDLNQVTRSLRLIGDDPLDWGGIYLFQERAGFALNPDQRLWELMKPFCKAVWVEDGFVGGQRAVVARGEARLEHGFGWICRAGLVPMGMGGSSTSLAIVGHFRNETLNAEILRTARIEYSGDPVDV